MNYHIVGIDGSGKTSLLNAFKNKFSTLRVPQYHMSLTPKSSIYTISEAFEDIGILADKLNSPELKVSCLFGAMSLYSSVLKDDQYKNEKTILTERHPLVDSLILSQAYGPHLKQVISEEALNECFKNEKTKTQIELIRKYFFQNLDMGELKDLPQKIKNLIALKSEDLLKEFVKIYRLDFKNSELIFLILDPAEIEERLASKIQKELHEDAKLLTFFQGKYIEFLKSLDAGKVCRVHFVDTKNKNLESLSREIVLLVESFKDTSASL